MAKENEIWLTAGVQNEPGAFAVDLRVNPEPVIGADGLRAQTANQHLNEHSHGLAPGSDGLTAFSSSFGRMAGAAFVELLSSVSGPTLVHLRYITRLGKLSVTMVANSSRNAGALTTKDRKSVV